MSFDRWGFGTEQDRAEGRENASYSPPTLNPATARSGRAPPKNLGDSV